MTKSLDWEVRSSRDNMQLVSSFINLERRRLTTGCYNDCLHAMDAISFRIEILSFLDNFFFAGGHKNRAPADRFLNEALNMLMLHYAPARQDWTIDVSGTLSQDECRSLCLILNELLIPWARDNNLRQTGAISVAISCDCGLLRVRLDLAPRPEQDKAINLIVISDLLKQHDGEMSSQDVDGAGSWVIEFPLTDQPTADM
ncbi:MAG: hypothetical protein Pars92KO_23900 [Parasphingorhabdus sp.]